MDVPIVLEEDLSGKTLVDEQGFMEIIYDSSNVPTLIPEYVAQEAGIPSIKTAVEVKVDVQKESQRTLVNVSQAQVSACHVCLPSRFWLSNATTKLMFICNYRHAIPR